MIEKSHEQPCDDFAGNIVGLVQQRAQGTANDRVALFLMDYARRERLKLIGHAEVISAQANPALAAELAPEGVPVRLVERMFRIRVTGLDWNCPKYITPRFTADEVERAAAPLRQRIAELEAQLRAKI